MEFDSDAVRLVKYKMFLLINYYGAFVLTVKCSGLTIKGAKLLPNDLLHKTQVGVIIYI